MGVDVLFPLLPGLEFTLQELVSGAFPHRDVYQPPRSYVIKEATETGV